MTTDEHGQPKHTLFSELLVQRMNAYDPPVRQRDLAQWLGVSGAIVWNWINRGSVPRDPALLHRLAQAFGDPPEMWFRAAGRPFWPAVAEPSAGARPARSAARTREQRLLADIENTRNNPDMPAEAKAAMIAILEQVLQGWSSPREQLLESEHVVEGVSGTFVTVPKGSDEHDVSEQPTKQLDALRRPSQYPQTSKQSNADGEPTQRRALRPPGTQQERRAAGTGTARTRAHRATSGTGRPAAAVKDS